MATRNPHTLHPDTYDKYCAHMKEMRAQGFNPRGVCFYRSEDEQLDVFNKGLSKTRFGWHNITREGYPCSYAYDICLLSADDREVLANDDPAWEICAKIGEDCGMFSGGLNWGWDWGHFQDSVGLTIAEARAGRNPINAEEMVEAEGENT